MKKYLKLFLALAAAAVTFAACSDDDEDSLSSLTAPTNVTCSSKGTSSLTFTWDEVSSAVRYSARLELTSDSSDYETETVTGNTVTFNGLSSGTSYTFKVRSLGSGNTYSDYSTSVVVSTASSGSDSEDDSGDNNDDDSGTVSDDVYAQFLISEEEDNLGSTLAFPGAEGGGMYTTGGRGGKIIHVTNLNDSGTGSLRYALSQSGARIIVFDVAGTIELASDIKVTNGDVTIAGQTAPGDGICLAYYTFQIDADNVIIRFLRFRRGDEKDTSDNGDATWGRYHSNIILDHCTMSWSIDECASFYGNCNFTMQWCFITEALNDAGHDKGEHGYGGIWGGKNASFHHNLLAHNASRNARLDHPGIYGTGGKYLADYRGNVDYRNNVIYHWYNYSTYGGEDGWFNIVGNYFKTGPSYKSVRDYYVYACWDNSNSTYQSSEYPELYLEGNYHTDGLGDSYSNGVCYQSNGPTAVTLTSPLSIKCDDTTPCYVTTHAYTDSYNQVLAYGGASLARDDVDTRIVSEVQNGSYTYTGTSGGYAGIIDHVSDTGSRPTYSATSDEISAQTTDTDGDGMPDWFETQFGLSNSTDDASSKTLDKYGRYTNFEMYLHYLVRNVMSSEISSGTYTALD